MADGKDIEVGDRVSRALESDVPRIYFNGFVNAFSAGDILCVLESNGHPVGIMNMSYTVAKTLSAGLGQLITKLEEASGRQIMTTHEVGAFLEETSETTKKKTGRGRSGRKKNG